MASGMLVTSAVKASPDGLVLENAYLRVVVDPTVGKVVSFGRPGEANWFWQPKARETLPPDGAKILLVPQVFWALSCEGNGPDPALNGDPWEVLEADETHILMRSPLVTSVGAQVTWEMVLPPEGRALLTRYRAERVVESDYPLNLWLIARVPFEGVFLMASEGLPGKPMYTRACLRTPDLMGYFQRLDQAVLMDGNYPDQAFKLGTFGEWIAQVRGGCALVITTEPYRPGVPYCDGSNLQLFAFAGRLPFVELEWTGGMYSPPVGGVLEAESLWTVMDLPESRGDWPSSIGSGVAALKAAGGGETED